MRIVDLYGQGRPIFSFEFFPPKTDAGENKLMETMADLKSAVEPDFVSVTYGAGGSTRDRTHGVVTRIQDELGITGMAHQTCVAASRADVLDNVKRLVESGIENILALRGDPPETQETFEPPADGFSHANELLAFLSAEFDLSLGAACYPEVHPEAPSAKEDLDWTCAKVKSGAGFLTTQLFFDPDLYVRFVSRARKAGIAVPIVPGIMPITNLGQIERFTKMCGAELPEPLRERLQRCGDDAAAVMATGIEHAITQCRQLLEAGAPGLHFYTLNKSHATRSILAALRQI